MEDNEVSSITFSDTPQEMSSKLLEMKQRIGLVQRFFKEVMVRNQDYGAIQGTDKPTLLKPGAEKLCDLYGYTPKIKEIYEERDREKGFYHARVIISLVHRQTGDVVAEGVGESNTMEGRYRWRWVPEWKVPDNVETSGVYSEERRDRNGRNYRVYRLENEDTWILWNTVLKMAKKRALVDAALTATKSSGIFTQDVEDLQEWVSSAESADIATDAVKIQSKSDMNITQAQAKRIFALAKGRDKIVRDVLDEYGYERSVDVLNTDYSEICKKVESIASNLN